MGAKHPSRLHDVPDTLPQAAQPVHMPSIHLTETYRGQRRRAGTALSGRRTEYLRAFVGSFDDSVADRIMPCVDRFATQLVSGELPLPCGSAICAAADLDTGTDDDAAESGGGWTLLCVPPRKSPCASEQTRPTRRHTR